MKQQDSIITEGSAGEHLLDGFWTTALVVIVFIVLFIVVKWLFDRLTKGKDDSSLIRLVTLSGVVLSGLIVAIYTIPFFGEKEGFWTTALVVIGYFIVLFIVVKWFFDRQSKGKDDSSLFRLVVLFGVILGGLILAIYTIPVFDKKEGDIVSFIAIVLSAVIALSSTTFIGNAFAGAMIRTVNNFRPGDFIKVNEHFGRITERRLLHSEIQNEESDLITLPNLYLVTNPVKVTRSSGTFIHGSCSLGYDVNRLKIEKALLKAAELAELTDPFVRVMELGDFSVVYRIYGKVEKIKTILSAQSRLNAMMLDTLHEAGIEIVSPNFMNQRQIGDTVFIPQKFMTSQKTPATENPESLIFDKAEEAESIEKRKEKLDIIDQKLQAFNEELTATVNETRKEELESSINRWKTIKEKLTEKIDAQRDEMNSKK